MLRNVTLCASLLFGMMVLGSPQANAQAADYAFTAGQGNYNEMVGGTVLATGSNIYGYTGTQSIGFSFVYGGNTYTNVNISGNGYISFGIAPTAGTADIFHNPGSSAGAVAAWDNLLTGRSTSQLSFSSTGGVCVIQWRNVARPGLNGDVSNDDLNFQIRLTQNSNRIDVVYGTMSTPSAMGANIGLMFTGGPMAVVARAEGSPWNRPAIVSTAMESIARTNWAPTAGTTYSFTNRNYTSVNNNIGIKALESPNGKFSPNTNQEIKVRVKNWGNNNLDSCVINWSFNGVAKTPVRYYPQPALAPGQEAVITLGFHSFPANSFNTFLATTLTPNGVGDAVTGNDAFQTYIAPRVSGNLNISTGSGNAGVFQDFFTATRHLLVSGISGDVNVRVFNGEYNEQVIVGNIDNGGTSSMLRFYATNGDEPKITWTPQAFPDGAYSQYETGQSILTLDGTRNVTFDNLNFYLPTGINAGAFAYGDMEFSSGSGLDNVHFINNLFQGPDNYSSMTLTSNGIKLYTAFGASDIEFSNNTFDNYRSGPYIDASASNVSVVGNTFTDVGSGGYYVVGANSNVNENTVMGSTSFTTFEGLVVEGYDGHVMVSGNRISGELTTGTALGLALFPYTGSFTVTNNTVATTATISNYGLVVTGLQAWDVSRVYHNTVNISGTAANSASAAFRVNSNQTDYPGFKVEAINNIFHNYGTGANGGTAILVLDYGSLPITATTRNPLSTSDFNNLMTTGTNVGYWDGTLVPRNTSGNPLASWKTISGRESNSVSTAVQFVGGADLHLLAINPALWGTTLLIPQVPFDIDGQERIKPYMGADEVKPSVEIVQQPQSRYACLGESFNLIAIADVTAGATVKYQWQKDGVNLVGQTNAILAFNNVGYGASGVYTCLVSATDGSNVVEEMSEAATVIVVRSTAVTVQPASQPIALGGTATLEVQAEAIGGPANFVATYQWKKRYWNPNSVSYVDTLIVDNGRITGTQSNRLTIRNVNAADTANEYVVVVSGYCGTATSKPARLFVPLVVASNNTPGNCAGSNLTFEVAAFPSQIQGSGVTFQWFKDGQMLSNNARITGTNSKVLDITAAVAGDEGTYYAIATYGTTPIRSNDIDVTIGAAPAITTQPVGATVCAGADVTVTAAASGQDLSYRWMKGTTAIVGQTTATLSLTNVATDDAGSYSLEVSNSCGAVTTTSVDVAVNTAPTIGTNPTNQALTEGNTLTLAVTATGTAPITYQWYKDGAIVAGATTASYSKTGVTGEDVGSYTVIVTNTCGSDTSDASVVSVVVGVAGDIAEAGYVLTGATPNPAVDGFSFNYTLAASQSVTITVTDLTGRMITVLAQGAMDAGTHRVSFDATALGLQAGVYNYSIQAGTFAATHQVVIVK